MSGFDSNLLAGTPGEDSQKKGTQRAQLHCPLFVYIDNHCGVVCGNKNYVVLTEVLELFKGQKMPLVPGNLCVSCFLEGTRFPLQCDCLSECPSFLLRRL